MAKNNGYSFEAGKYNPTTQTDVIPELEKSNQELRNSEINYSNELRDRDQQIIDRDRAFFKQLGTLSTKINDWADSKYAKDKEEQLARGAYLAIINPASEEEIAALRDQEFGLQDAHLKVNEIANQIEEETGSFEQAQSFRELSGWEQYAYVKGSLQNEAKDYTDFKNNIKSQIKVVIDGREVNYDNAANDAERSSLDAKVKFEFSKKFLGVNPVLLNDTVGKEIQKIDDADFEEARKERDEKAKAFEKKKELSKILINVTDDPAASSDYADFWVQKNKGLFGGTQGARLQYADNLVALVEAGQLNLTDALNMIDQQFYHSGNKRMEKMSVYKEWEDLEDRLKDANTTYYSNKKDDDKAQALAQSDLLFEQVENGAVLTVEQKQNYYKNRMKQFPDVPLTDKEEFILYGYRDDDVMRQELAQKAEVYGGVTERDLRQASPDVRREFKDRMIPAGDKQITTINSLGQADRAFITDHVKGAAKITGELDVKSTTYYALLVGAEREFLTAYNSALIAGNDPMTAMNAAKQHLVTKTTDDVWISENSQYNVYDRDKEYETKFAEGLSQVQPEDAGFARRLLSAPVEVKEDLLKWANAGGKGIVPYYYQTLANRNNIIPRELAWRQAEIMGYEGQTPDISKEAEKFDYPISLLKMFLKNPTKNKQKRLAIDAPGYVKGEYKPSEYYPINEVHPYEEEEDID